MLIMYVRDGAMLCGTEDAYTWLCTDGISTCLHYTDVQRRKAKLAITSSSSALSPTTLQYQPQPSTHR
jgi:hypothetical protein